MRVAANRSNGHLIRTASNAAPRVPLARRSQRAHPPGCTGPRPRRRTRSPQGKSTLAKNIPSRASRNVARLAGFGRVFSLSFESFSDMKSVILFCMYFGGRSHEIQLHVCIVLAADNSARNYSHMFHDSAGGTDTKKLSFRYLRK